MPKKNWLYIWDAPKVFCPLCRVYRRLVRISWMHHWNRCEYCLLSLPTGKAAKRVLYGKRYRHA